APILRITTAPPMQELDPMTRTAPASMTVIAETGERFLDFSPYVAAMGEDGVVWFQASTADGRSGVFAGAGDAVATAVIHPTSPCGAVCSHPDIDGDRSVCFFGHATDGRQGLFVSRSGSQARL